MGIIIHEYAFDKLYSIDADSIGIGLIEIWRYFPGAVLNLADKRVILEPSLFCERFLVLLLPSACAVKLIPPIR